MLAVGYDDVIICLILFSSLYYLKRQHFEPQSFRFLEVKIFIFVPFRFEFGARFYMSLEYIL